MPKESPALRVLVVEDEPLIRWSVTETLAQAGHTVFEAGDGASARRAVREASGSIDVVLLDFRLPDSHDLTLLSDVRRLMPRSAVLLITAFATPDLVADALARGADRVLSKPLDIHDLLPLVLHAHGRRSH
jgi:two-component system, NtrC family, response regulator AtoC